MTELIDSLRAALDAAELDAQERRGTFPNPVYEDEHGNVWLNNLSFSRQAIVVKYPHPVEGWVDVCQLQLWTKPRLAGGWNDTRVLRLIERDRRVLAEYEGLHYDRARLTDAALNLSYHLLGRVVAQMASFWLPEDEGSTE